MFMVTNSIYFYYTTEQNFGFYWLYFHIFTRNPISYWYVSLHHDNFIINFFLYILKTHKKILEIVTKPFKKIIHNVKKLML